MTNTADLLITSVRERTIEDKNTNTKDFVGWAIKGFGIKDKKIYNLSLNFNKKVEGTDDKYERSEEMVEKSKQTVEALKGFIMNKEQSYIDEISLDTVEKLVNCRLEGVYVYENKQRDMNYFNVEPYKEFIQAPKPLTFEQYQGLETIKKPKIISSLEKPLILTPIIENKNFGNFFSILNVDLSTATYEDSDGNEINLELSDNEAILINRLAFPEKKSEKDPKTGKEKVIEEFKILRFNYKSFEAGERIKQINSEINEFKAFEDYYKLYEQNDFDVVKLEALLFGDKKASEIMSEGGELYQTWLEFDRFLNLETRRQQALEEVAKRRQRIVDESRVYFKNEHSILDFIYDEIKETQPKKLLKVKSLRLDSNEYNNPKTKELQTYYYVAPIVEVIDNPDWEETKENLDTLKDLNLTNDEE